MSESPPETRPGTGRPRSEKKLFGLPRNAVILGAVAFAGTVLYLWFKNRGNPPGQSGTQASAGTGSSDATDFAGQLGELEAQIQQLQQAGAGTGSGASGGSGGAGGSYGGTGGGWSYGNWDGSQGQGSNGGSTSGSGSSSSGGSTSGSGSSSSGGSTSGSGGSAGPAPAPTGGHAVRTSAGEADVSWNGNGAASWNLVINGPGPINGHTAHVTDSKGHYGGLQGGHTYTVTITPLNSAGTPGPSGHIFIPAG